MCYLSEEQPQISADALSRIRQLKEHGDLIRSFADKDEPFYRLMANCDRDFELMPTPDDAEFRASVQTPF